MINFDFAYYLIDLEGNNFEIEIHDMCPGWNLPFKDFAARTYQGDIKYSLVIF